MLYCSNIHVQIPKILKEPVVPIPKEFIRQIVKNVHKSNNDYKKNKQNSNL